MTRQCAGWRRTCSPAASAAPTAGRATRSTGRPRTRVMPIEPSGTRPISTWRRDSVSHSSEPTPMPTENTTSSSVATCSSPCSTSLAKGGNGVRNTDAEEPHPRDAQQRAEHDDVVVRELEVGQVSVTGFQLMRGPDRWPAWRHELRRDAAEHRQGEARHGHRYGRVPTPQAARSAGRRRRCRAGSPRRCPSRPCRCRRSARARRDAAAGRRT